jgi:hypothetical protein
MWHEANNGKVDIGKWQEAERPLRVSSSLSLLYHLGGWYRPTADIRS